MIVMKFGGTSVASPERIRGVAELVRAALPRNPVVVVSALSGVTDLLIRGARLAQARDPAAEGVPREILARHTESVHALVPRGEARDRLMASVERSVERLRTLLTGVLYLGELTPRSLDAVAGLGERLACEMVAEAFAAAGLGAAAVDAQRVVITDDGFGHATPLANEIGVRVGELVHPLVAARVVPVLGGFIGATRDGVATTLGRGGSDYTAAILGAALPAEEIQIWTDVDGMMTADPRVVPGARAIPEVAFEEAAELAYFGAKVLHPATIRPAVEKGIPVLILNTLNPAAAGTRIRGRIPVGARGEPRAVAFKKGITVLLIAQPRMLMAYGFVARVFEVFDRHRTPVDLIATSEVSISLTVDDSERLGAIQADLAALSDVRVIPRMAIVSVVGRGFIGQPGLAGRIFHALRDVNLVMISFGASDVNVSFVVAEGDAERAVRMLHREFFEEAQG